MPIQNRFNSVYSYNAISHFSGDEMRNYSHFIFRQIQCILCIYIYVYIYI